MESENEPSNSDSVSPGDTTPDALPSLHDGRNNPSGLGSFPLPKDPHAP